MSHFRARAHTHTHKRIVLKTQRKCGLIFLIFFVPGPNRHAVKICRDCFFAVFEEEIHQVIVENQLFKPGERIAIGASGGKGRLSQSDWGPLLFHKPFLLIHSDGFDSCVATILVPC